MTLSASPRSSYYADDFADATPQAKATGGPLATNLREDLDKTADVTTPHSITWERARPEPCAFVAKHDSHATRLLRRHDSPPVATLLFGAQVSKLGISCVSADQYRFINESAYHATPDDLALFVTYSGTLVPEHARIPYETLRERHCKIAIVTSLSSVADKFSGFDYPLVAPNRENRFGKISTFHSQTCLRYALDCVYSVIFCGNYSSNLIERELIERLEPGLAAERTVR